MKVDTSASLPFKKKSGYSTGAQCISNRSFVGSVCRTGLTSMFGKNRQLVIDEPVKFEK